jgi:hypothetical protein
MRASQRDFLFSFKRYAKGHNCYYYNCFTSFYPGFFKLLKFDLVIFTWSFLDSRFMRNDYLKNFKKINFVKNWKCPKVMMPQDEFSNTDLLNLTANHFKVSNIYSVSPESEWDKLYKKVDFKKIKFQQTLTGYIDESLIKEIKSISDNNNKNRKIDIGYRSGSAAYWGRFNLIKFQLADIFINVSKKYSFKIDIKFGWKNFLSGNDWYKFLLNCRYIPGVEGGSSIIDWNGSLVESVHKYLKKYPKASYDDVELNCIPQGKDGEINVVALSPRHLEACITKTCQILVKGSYNGILKPGIHYIELEKDFSNIEEVCLSLNNEERRLEIVDRAYKDIVLSKKYTYKSMVNLVFSNANISKNNTLKELNPMYLIHLFFEKINIIFIYIFSSIRIIRNELIKTFNKI